MCYRRSATTARIASPPAAADTVNAISLMQYGVMLPWFFGTLGLIFFSLRGEGAILREHLQPEVRSGLLAVEELQALSTISGRMLRAWQALAAGGLAGWWTRGQFHQIASELAFHRWRVVRGICPADGAAASREAGYVQRLRELRTSSKS